MVYNGRGYHYLFNYKTKLYILHQLLAKLQPGENPADHSPAASVTSVLKRHKEAAVGFYPMQYNET